MGFEHQPAIWGNYFRIVGVKAYNYDEDIKRWMRLNA
jgi:hypothetical protein